MSAFSVLAVWINISWATSHWLALICITFILNLYWSIDRAPICSRDVFRDFWSNAYTKLASGFIVTCFGYMPLFSTFSTKLRSVFVFAVSSYMSKLQAPDNRTEQILDENSFDCGPDCFNWISNPPFCVLLIFETAFPRSSKVGSALTLRSISA